MNVWQYEPEVLATEYWQLEREFPGRLLLGIGIGHPEATDIYQRPLAKMRGFLDGLDRADPPVPRDRRCLAALAPRMLELAAARSRGAHTYFVGPQHTRIARERVGGDAVIAAELACVLDADGARARATARSYAQLYLGLRNYTSNLLRSGFTDEDLTGGGSDALIDAVVPHGTPNQIAAAARAHLDAGADHVCLQTVGVQGVPDEQWAALAGALRER